MKLTYLMFNHGNAENLSVPVMVFTDRQSAEKRFKEIFGDVQNYVVEVDWETTSEEYERITTEIFDSFSLETKYFLTFWLKDGESGEKITDWRFENDIHVKY